MVSKSNPNSRGEDYEAESMADLKHYAGYIIAAIVLALVGYFGWHYWQGHSVSPDTVASEKYAAIQQLNDRIIIAEQNPDLPEAAQQALETDRSTLSAQVEQLVSNHPDSVYTWQALLLTARQQADSNDYQGASESLKEAMNIPLQDAGLKAMTQLRYASALLAAGDIDTALSVASKEVPNAFEASKQELLGDIYLQQNKTQEAERAYENAWNLLVDRKEERAILRLKMEGIGIMPQEIPKRPALVAATPAPLSDTTVEVVDEVNNENIADEADTSQQADNADNNNDDDTVIAVQ